MTPHGVEFLIRRMTGPSEASRLVVANQVNAILTTDAHTDILDDLEPSATGEFVFVACLASDTIGWLINQLNPRGDVFSAVVGVAEVMIATTQVARAAGLAWPSMEDLGWERDTTLQQVLLERPAEHLVLLSP